MCPQRFSDVHPTDYFYTPVLYLACRGVVSGYSDGTYRPYNTNTRSQMIKIAVLGFQVPIYTPPPGVRTFEDVQPTNNFFAVIESAAHAAIITGYNCGTRPEEPCVPPNNRTYFRPYAYVTRGQLSKIIVLSARWQLTRPPSPSFEDVPSSSAFYDYVETAYSHGIISGYDCGGPGEPCGPLHRPYFRTFNNATRGQIAKLAWGALTRPSLKAQEIARSRSGGETP